MNVDRDSTACHATSTISHHSNRRNIHAPNSRGTLLALLATGCLLSLTISLVFRIGSAYAREVVFQVALVKTAAH